MSYDPETPLLSIYPDKTIIKRETLLMTPMLIVSLFTIAKMWKQSKCPSTDEWIKKIQSIYIYIYTHIYNGILLIHKKEWSNAIVATLAGSRDYHTKWSQPETEKWISSDITYMWNLKDDPNELICKTDSQT